MSVVTCAPGLEKLLQKELEQLSIPVQRTLKACVVIPAAIELNYRACYESRLASRVLFPLIKGRIRQAKDLYELGREFPWEDWLPLTDTFAIDANGKHPQFTNTFYAAQLLKDSICDRFRDIYQKRPSIDPHQPAHQLSLFFYEGEATIYWDMSGAPLFKREYREESGAAPLPATLASALLYRAGFHGEKTLFDPFCGSGTILMEACMIATYTPAGFYRQRWGFLQHPDFLKSKWLQYKKQRDAAIQTNGPFRAYGSDQSPEAVMIAKKTLEKGGFGSLIELQVSRMESTFSPADLVVTNPPFGRRLVKDAQIDQSLERLSTRCPVFYLTPNLPQKCRHHWPLFHGGLEIFLVEL